MVSKVSLIQVSQSAGGGKSEQIELPEIFETPYRPEIIHKVYVNLRSHTFQRQGRYPAAGEMVSAESRNTGLGIARLARARGEGFGRAGQAASVAGVRHGRVAHPPESWRRIYKSINKKERRLGFCSAIASTARKDLVEGRGHKLSNKTPSLPLVVSDEIESISSTKVLKDFLVRIGLENDLERANSARKVRSGTARRRGRRARIGTSVLVVVSKNSKLLTLTRSLPGLDVKAINEISVLDLAPGSKSARLTIYSRSAIEQLEGVNATYHRIIRLVTGK